MNLTERWAVVQCRRWQSPTFFPQCPSRSNLYCSWDNVYGRKVCAHCPWALFLVSKLWNERSWLLAMVFARTGSLSTSWSLEVLSATRYRLWTSTKRCRLQKDTIVLRQISIKSFNFIFNPSSAFWLVLTPTIFYQRLFGIQWQYIFWHLILVFVKK